MTCKRCMKQTIQNHLHQTHLCRIITDLRPGNGRRCRGCTRGMSGGLYVFTHMLISDEEHPSQGFSGLQCTSCRRWELCYNCLVNKNQARHPSCEGRATVWELILPKSNPNGVQNSNSTAQKVIKKVGDNPVISTAVALGGILAAAALEDDD